MNQPSFLRDLWYFAIPGASLEPGRMTSLKMLGEPILIGRQRNGQVFALRDLCPHRGVPLSHGKFDGSAVQCCYHGWRFAPDGACIDIPSLTRAQREKFKLGKIRAYSYPCAEVQGNIWIHFSTSSATTAPIEEIPQIDGIGDGRAQLAEQMIFEIGLDHAVIGLMDPAHGPYVHRAWWWRSATSMHEKSKRFVPSHLGFTMSRHRPSSNSRAYVVLGGVPETEISFQLPGIRIEHARTGSNYYCGLTAITPIDECRSRISHVMYWSLPLLTALRPLVRIIARRFLDQDRRVIEMQRQGLEHGPELLLINDADRQARWYHQLKAEFNASRAQARPFENPVRERVLHWRS